MNTKLRYIAVLSWFLCFLLVFSAASFGQGIVNGSISGTVLDPQKAVVPGAKVTAVQSGTGTTSSTKTNGEGYFLIANLPIGTYSLTVEAPKFSNLKVNDVAVTSGQNTNIGGVSLNIGVAGESIVVEASAPLIETTSAQVGGSFDSKAVSQLPNAMTGFDNLALYVPGVANNGATNFSNNNGATIANNGLRGRSNNFQIDGQANNDNSVAGPSVFLSNPDVLGEVQIVSNNFGAEYGRNSGTIVNYVTKSGTNSYHGTGYEYNQGNWSFSKTNGQKNPLLGFCPSGVAAGTPTAFASSCLTPVIPRFVENRFGGTFGGPVIKNKLWFFASYQDDKQRSKSSATSTSLTPNPAGIAALAAAFPGNPAVAALQQFGPYGITVGNPTPAGTVQTINVSNGATTVAVPFQFVSRTVGTPFDDTQITGRGDWQISGKDRFFMRYVYQDSLNAVSGTISSGAFVALPAHDEQYGWDYTRDWSANIVQQVRVSYSKSAVTFAGGQAFPECTIANVLACPPNIAFSDPVSGRSYTAFGLATNLPQDRQVHNTQYQSNLTWVKGHHTMKFGGEFDHQSSPNHFLPAINGGYTFTSAPAAGANPAVDAFSQFIRGGTLCTAVAPNTCSSLSLTNGPFNFNFLENDLYFYGQDDWRIKSNLTINLGLRWEWDQQAINLLHDISVQNVAAGFWNPAISTNVTEVPKIPEALHNFGPNIGFAWTPHILHKLMGEDKTVIRGGYRMAYDPAFYNIFLNIATSAPVVNSGAVSNVGLPGTLTGQGVQNAFLGLIPTGQNPGQRLQTRVTPDFHNPYVEQWSLGVERQITGRVSLEVRYVGNHGVGNFQTINDNPLICSAFTGSTCTAGLAVQAPYAIPAGIVPCTPAAAAAAGNPNNPPSSTGGVGRVDCNFNQERVRNNGAWSTYHGLQTEFKMRSFHGFTANVAYTWSKGLDNTSEIFSSTGGVSTPVSANPFDPNNGERGVAAQSYPHVITTYWIYELPWKKNQQGILGHILGGWQWSGTHRYQPGVGTTPDQSTGNADPYCDNAFNVSFVGVDSCRPILSNPNAPADTSGRYLDATHLVAVSNCATTSFANVTFGPGTASCPFISPSDVRFIVNNTFAVNALCGGNPFACAVSRNIYRAYPRNQLDLSVAKNIRLTERIGLQLRADVLNALNYQYLGVQGLNVNNKNTNGIGLNAAGTAVVATPNTFGEFWGATGTNRSIILNAHVNF